MREDIQALRAFAVIAVLLFHVDLPFTQGGYLGVDIFFVISGFVITGLILRELRAGEFSFRQFYIKRVCRILPASTVTIALTFIVGAFVMTYNDLRYLGASSVVALTSVSNIHFWLESGYFDEASHLKPLLHTWSLAVEEQFYLLWPAVMVFAFNRRILVATIAIAGLFSLIAAEMFLTSQPDATFFLMPFRVFEFCAGAILHFLPASRRAWPFYPGVAIMVASVALLDSSYAMPGLVSLVPVAGAALCLVSGGSLGWRFPSWIVGIGNASYSVYLAHWPLIVFYKYLYSTHLQASEQVFLVAVSLILGFSLNRAIERPMRPVEFWRSRSPRMAGAAMFAGIAVASSSAWGSNGWAWRVPDDIKEAVSDITNLRDERMAFQKGHATDRFASNGRKILIIGDSHGQDLFNAIYQAGAKNLVRIHIDYRCQPVGGIRPIEQGQPALVVTNSTAATGCQRAVSRRLRDPLIREADVVILSARWKTWALGRVPAAVALLRKQTQAPIFVFGPQAEFDPVVPRIVERHGGPSGLDARAALSEDRSRRTVNRLLRTLVRQTDATYVDKFDLLCKAGPCPVIVPGSGKLFVWDYGHWTLEGARHFGEVIRNNDAVSRVLFAAGSG